MMDIGVHIECSIGRGSERILIFIPHFYDRMGLVQSESICGAFQGVQLGSDSSMSGILEGEHERGNHFYAFFFFFTFTTCGIQGRSTARVLMILA